MKTYIAILFFLISFGAFGQNNTLFQHATGSYNEGDYKKAIGFYEQILENKQHSSELYFNLGNAYYKLGEIGPSIYYYEKALLLKPNDVEIKNNLSYANNMKLDAIEEMPETVLVSFYNSVVNYFSFEQWAYLAVFMVFLFVLGYIIYYFLYNATYKRISFIVSVLAMVLAVFSVVMAYFQFNEFKKDNPAIIFSREIVVTSEPNNRSERLFTLHEGTKVNVLEQLGDWQKVKIPDGQTGWLLAENLKLLKKF
ncbi:MULTISPECIES: tetratricopeptide repeat protein [Croceitalea]|uniref:Tetratricopeptide repeat protein n=1 Tax=Croceitalea vernalis TaxID=3075599 RepID=A0ABU3BCW5_9FLAO|nr:MULTISPECIES: tetratricopeptide repeat protein [unclassified Croceitalea]MDT0538537.1 tetratricopeptide repeat protein [Croceitalea sp. P059]MDT0620317.1 tetratricopeptide repeat protein [Croceitalea sp. P007]